MNIVLLGRSITSSRGNGHATNYRGLVRALSDRGHDVLFLERDLPSYAAHRDLPRPPGCTTGLYGSLDELRADHAGAVRDADTVIVGSHVPEGAAIGEWVVETTRGVPVFYDLDTPVTLAKLARGGREYLTPELVRAYRLYLSSTGGRTPERIEDELGSPCARAFHCLVDPGACPVLDVKPRWDLGYLGAYSPDRQPALARLLLEPARRRPALRCVVAGSGYPGDIAWLPNVERIEHLAPSEYPAFYAAQRFTVKVTGREMVAAGWSPDVQLFEAAACAVPIISDVWAGLETFFAPGEEILLPDGTDAVLRMLVQIGEHQRRVIGRRARDRVLARHTADHRAAELEEAVLGVRATV
jgi:spore maturation protein CgeB